ncbi:MAG: acetolactate decarboxylase [Alphaproteobacteria bacterium]|nr:acetolactate decarboxylase [Alphaproteobacteria bacterium]
MLKLRLLVFALVVVGSAGAQADESARLFQYSTINALLHGLYEGDLTIGELARHGDFGLGTLNRIDGELVAADGDFYQVRTDGRAYPLAPEAKTPFAVVTRFTADRTLPVEGGRDLAAFKARLDGLLQAPNYFTAIRVDGRFAHLVVRSVPKQTPPFRPLAEIIGKQVKFELTDVTGTLVGIRTPDYMAGLNVPGYHFHFLTADRARGGHVLALTTGSGTVAIDEIAVFEMQLPRSAEFAKIDLSGARADEIDKVEKVKD